MPRVVLTIGYGLRPIGEVVDLLRLHEVEYVADVRSVPYSGRRPEVARPELESRLASAGLRYVFLGEQLGGRPDDPSCYDSDGRVDYDRCRVAPSFVDGIARVERAFVAGRRVALLCSESRPTECHRSKLLAEMLVERGVPVAHIDEHGELVEHDDLASQLFGAQMSIEAKSLGRSRKSYRHVTS